ncbi:hypothetical protein [Bombella intestini]|nr:hypothetical protein [Bombella intestini]
MTDVHEGAWQMRLMIAQCRKVGLYGGMMALAMSALAGAAQAEGLDRVYEVQAQLSPTALVAGNSSATDVLKTQLGPNIRQKQEQKTVAIGQGGYRLSQYRMRVRLSHGNGGGYDNGTLSYVISASLSRMSHDHTASIFTRVRGVLKLHNGQAAGALPANRYFTGTVQINAIAAKLF